MLSFSVYVNNSVAFFSDLQCYDPVESARKNTDMTELIVARGDTFPRAFLDTYRANKSSEQYYSELSSSKSDELVLQNSSDIPISEEIHHGHSENLLDIATCLTPSKDEYVDKQELILPKVHRRRVPVYDRVDPEDSIRDIVTENDFYRYVKEFYFYVHIYVDRQLILTILKCLFVWEHLFYTFLFLNNIELVFCDMKLLEHIPN